MADLNEVLEACDAWQSRDNRFKEDEFEQARDTASTLASWLDTNGERLAKFELEQAARNDRGITTHCPVLIVPSSASKPTMGSIEYRGGAPLVIVGANWKPEAGR